MKFKCVIVLLMAVQVASVNAASFNCEKASAKVERLICQDQTLSAVDDIFSNNYKMMSSANIGDGARRDLRKGQIDWLKQRNFCEDKACVLSSYLKRNDEICDIPVVGGVHPPCRYSDEIEGQLGLKKVNR